MQIQFKLALYPENTFNENNWDEDEYDYAADRIEKFELYLVKHHNNIPFAIQTLNQNINWTEDNNEYCTRLSYISDGKFEAEFYFNYASTIIDADKDTLFETAGILLSLGDDPFVIINGNQYELDIEIDDVKLVSENSEEENIEQNNNEYEEYEQQTELIISDEIIEEEIYDE